MLESGRWGLAKCRPVALGEVAQFGEAEERHPPNATHL